MAELARPQLPQVPTLRSLLSPPKLAALFLSARGFHGVQTRQSGAGSRGRLAFARQRLSRAELATLLEAAPGYARLSPSAVKGGGQLSENVD